MVIFNNNKNNKNKTPERLNYKLNEMENELADVMLCVIGIWQALSSSDTTHCLADVEIKVCLFP